MSVAATKPIRALTQTRVGRWITLPLVVLAGLLLFAWPRYRITVNLTKSVPFKVFLIDVGNKSPVRGDYVVFKWRGGAGYEAETQFIKRVEGIGGQAISRVGRVVMIDNVPVARALERSPKGTVLEPIAAQSIGAEAFYVSSDGRDAFDSRYEAFGLIHRNEIIGAAWALF
jgi:conjugal transfer pilin signal peptidase TrbI